MKDYGITESTVKPPPIKLDKYSVWIATDITLASQEIEGEMVDMYQYRLKQYSKDEYIKDMGAQLTNVQLAMCDMYEALTEEE